VNQFTGGLRICAEAARQTPDLCRELGMPLPIALVAAVVVFGVGR
jgi:hypothetical protein